MIANEPAASVLRDRQIRFDIRVRFDQGDLANIEMTLNPRGFETLRLEYYLARLYSGQDIRGSDKSFGDLRPAYRISLVGRKRLFPDGALTYHFSYYDREHGTALARILASGRFRFFLSPIKASRRINPLYTIYPSLGGYMVRLNPLNDFCFLSILGRRGCEPQLLSFLNALLYPSGDNPIRSVEIIEHTALPAEIISGKKSVLDVRALLVDKTQINIEVQLTNEYNIEQRSLYYWARQYTQGIGAGQDYKELPRVIAIEAVPKPQFWNSFLPLEKIA